MTQTEPGRIPDSRGLQFIELRDFTPGIFSDIFSNPQNAPDGALQIEGTWGCVSSPNGGLQPGPRKIQKMRQPLINADVGNSYDPNEPSSRLHVLAMRNVSPVYAHESNYQGLTKYPDMPVIVFEWHFFDGTTWRERLRCRLYRPFLETTRPGTALDFNFEDPAAVTNATHDIYTRDEDSSFNYATSYALRYSEASLDSTRVNKGDPTIPGYISVIFWFYPARVSGGSGITRVFPDPDAVVLDGQEATVLPPYSGEGFCHQGRSLGLRTTLSTNTLGLLGVSASEVVDYTRVNTTAVLESQSAGVVFVEENASGYGAYASMNAGEAFLIKKKGGAVAIRGDVANPQVVRLPGVHSTGEFGNVPVVCPLGLVYGSVSGVWLWTGGDTSQCISTQLDGTFWLVDDDDRLGPYGRFGYEHPYVFAPNNFIMDVRTGGWFRIADSPKYSFWDGSVSGRMLGTPFYIEEDNDYEAIGWFDVRQGTNEYRARTQPLSRTQNRRLGFREVVGRFQGKGRITVTMTPLDGGEPGTVEFDVPDGNPLVIRRPIGVQGQDVVVDIHSVADDSEGPAPRVNWMAFGFREGAQVGSR